MNAAVVPLDEATKARLRAFIRDKFGDGLRRGKPTLHTYTDATGAPLFWKLRIKFPDGEKLIRPIYANGAGFEIGEPKFEFGQKPLYRLHEIVDPARRGEPVFVVEGENCADALAAIGLLATTSGGARSVAATDWTSLRGRSVIVWPDNDEAGRGYGRDVAAALTNVGCTIEIVRVDALGLPDGGDCVDWLAAHVGATREAVLTLPRVPTAAEGDDVEVECGADVAIEPVRWVWRGWLAAGKLHILAGAPGAGKSTLALSLGSTVTRGSTWPDGTRCVEAGNVVIWTSEDSIADTLAPRLIAAGADMRRVHFVRSTRSGNVKRPFDPATDIPLLAQKLASVHRPKLLILDPIVNAVAGDSHKNSEVRRDLQPVVDLAESVGCAVIGITHLTKGTAGREPLERVTGSLAFGALPRIVLLAARNKAGESPPRLLVRPKSNIGEDGGGFGYDLRVTQVEGVETVRIDWLSPLDGTARELLDAAEGGTTSASSSATPKSGWPTYWPTVRCRRATLTGWRVRPVTRGARFSARPGRWA